ncbi:hypothetical protein OWR29_39985 [Actinoplanes sp. Pm04-4]|uniref:Uncharacterized protein n=1 Tax=Paractinoplanes pyxinae TaxID=2997416 RepID=A0ABT4BF65_9ACTN|nr:hypothetical protein [Actinoplanes pyxinae]MCY1144210.1 hypothetical protein [Actinoplanes pyxinae]
MVLSLSGACLGDRAVVAKGAAMADRLERPHHVYAAGTCDPACEFSPLASALGNWISRTADVPRTSWQQEGLCQGYLCAGPGSDDAALQEIYVALSCDRPGCGSEIP